MRTKTRYHVAAGLLLMSLICASQESLACNEPPVANISNWFQIVAPGDRIFLDGTGSYDPDGYITDWYWDYPGQAYDIWGQGGSRFACNIDEVGSYGFCLSVTDNEGAWAWDSATVYVVGAQTIEYEDPDLGWTSFGVLYVHLGTTVTFRATPSPGSSWPYGKPVWGGTAGASGTGSTKSVTFNTLSTSLNDYKTITVECGNTLTANVIVYDFEGVFTPADNFSGRSTEYYGIEEQVALNYRSDPWSVPGNCIGGLEWTKGNPSQCGVLSNVNVAYGSADYDAGASSGFVVCVLTIQSGPSKDRWKSYQKDIVLPSGTRMTRATGNVKHNYGTASAGIAVYYWLNPKNVSFRYLTFGEGSCPATGATGIYVSAPPGSHPQNYFGAILGGNSTTGCRVQSMDGAWTERNPWGAGGTFSWSIPTEYIDDTAIRHPFGSNSVHSPTIQPNGNTTMSKAGQSGSAAVTDPTCGW